MTAMIGGRKNCLGGIFAFQHAGRMRNSNEKHRVPARIASGVVHCAAGMLFEHVVDVLHARDVALANGIDAFIKPANRRPERDAVIPNFSARL